MTALRACTRSPSDWIGFAFYGVLAVLTLTKMPSLGVLMLPTLALELFAAAAFLIRAPLRASDAARRGRISAYGGTLFLFVFILVAHAVRPWWLTPTTSDASRAAGLLLWVAGSVWAAYSVWYLRFAFSIEPEARRLVTSGPFGVARHPVYMGYFAQYAGMWLLIPTSPFGLALMIWMALMIDRMRNEERVLARAFPEYAEYRRRVGALGSTRRRPVRRSGSQPTDRRPASRTEPAIRQPAR